MTIYRIVNKINGKFYIGKTTKNLEERMRKHLNSKFDNTHSLIHRAIEKYGEENFYIEELCSCSSEKELNEKEIFYIKELNAVKLGYNLGIGGDGGDNISNHPDNNLIRKKISKASKNNWTEERKKNHSEKMFGKNNPNYNNQWGFKKGYIPKNFGKTFEEMYGEEKALEIKRKISSANLGIKKPGTANAMRKNNPSWQPEVKKKLSKAFGGKHHTIESKERMSKAHTGKILSEKHRLNIGRANSGNRNGRFIHIDEKIECKIISLYSDGFNLTDISKTVNISTRRISKFLKENDIEVKKSRPSKNWRYQL